MQSKAKQIHAKQSKAGLGGGSPPTRGLWGAGVPPGSETQFFVWPKAWYVCNLYRCFCSLAMSATSQQPWSRRRFGFKFSFKRSACACHGALHAQCPLFAATAALTADRDRGSRAIRNHHSARIPGTGQLCLARPAVLKRFCSVGAALGSACLSICTECGRNSLAQRSGLRIGLRGRFILCSVAILAQSICPAHSARLAKV